MKFGDPVLLWTEKNIQPAKEKDGPAQIRTATLNIKGYSIWLKTASYRGD
jgi:hypothetical protein